MPSVNYPSALAFSNWDKLARPLKKAKSITDLGEALKSLAKGHDAIAFDLFEIGKSAGAEAERRLVQIAAEAKKVRAIADAAKALDAQAKKLEAELKKDKQPPDAASGVAKAASAYASEMLKLEQAAAALQAELAKRIAEAKAAAKNDDKPNPELDKLAAKIKGRVLAALKLVMKPQAEPVPFIMGVGQKDCLVSMGPSVSASEKNLLMKLMTDDSGVKYYLGACTFEKKGQVFTFEGDSLPAGAGLGKKLQKGLHLQVGKKLRVRVRKPGGEAEEGEVLDKVDDLDDVDESAVQSDAESTTTSESDGGSAAALAAAETRLNALAARLAELGVSATPGAKDVAKRLEAARQAVADRELSAALKMLDQLDLVARALGAKKGDASGAAKTVDPALSKAMARFDALSAQLEASGVFDTPAGAQVKVRVEAVDQALKDAQTEAATKMLDQLDLVAKSVEQKKAAAAAAAAARSTAPSEERTSPQPKPAQDKREDKKEVYVQSRVKWDGARTKVQAELQRLEAAILAQARGEPDFDAIAAKTRKLTRILDQLDTRLIDRLNEAHGAKSAAEEGKAYDQAREVVKSYLSFVDTDPLLKAIDDNPFGKFDVRGSVHATLSELQSKFAVAPETA